jgi:SAM-dependent methyltransferase
MRLNDYDDYLKVNFDLSVESRTGDEVIEGMLIHRTLNKKYPITNGIPRIVDATENYTQNFGFQWQKYKYLQLDSVTKLTLSADRLFDNTKWTKEELHGKLVLEVGSGAGRFSEILVQTGAKIVSFDYSAAVNSNRLLNGNHENLFLFQGNLFDLPFPDQYFDYVFCYGVLQHTPDPTLAFKSIFGKLKKNGKISIDYYLNPEKPSIWTTPKYFWRPLTIKMKPQILLGFIKFYLFFWFHIDTLLKLLPKGIGYRLLSRIPLPCYNYLHSGLSYRQRWQWAILDTFDALSAKYDYPKTKMEFEEMISSVECSDKQVFYGSNGLVANMRKA